MENRANKLHALDPETYPRTGRMYFDIDPLEVRARDRRRARPRGEPVKVLYHSHLDAGAYFSETDAAATKMGETSRAYDLAYLVTSVRRREASQAAGRRSQALRVGRASRAFVEGNLVQAE